MKPTLYQIKQLFELGNTPFAIRFQIYTNLERIEEVKQDWITDFKNKELSKTEFRKNMTLCRGAKKHCLKMLDLSRYL